MRDRAGRVVGVGDVVVGGHICTAAVQNRQATDANGLVAAANVLVGEGLCCCRSYRFARTSACQCADRGRARCCRAAVIGLSCLHCSYRQGGRCHIHRLRAAGEGVVAGHAAVAAICQSQCADGHCLAGANVLGRYRSRAAQAQRFSSHQRAQRQCRGCNVRRAVVAACAAQVDCKRIDRAGRVVGVGDVVVTGHIRIAAVANHQATGAHGLVAATHILVGECLCCCCTDDFACTCQCADCGAACGCCAAVISFSCLHCRYRQASLGDVGAGCRTARHQRVVTQVSARQSKAAERHGLAGAYILVGKTGHRTCIQRDSIDADHASQRRRHASDADDRGAVINFAALPSQIQPQLFGGDVRRRGGRGRNAVVAAISAA